jgi:hypothetical protein
MLLLLLFCCCCNYHHDHHHHHYCHLDKDTWVMHQVIDVWTFSCSGKVFVKMLDQFICVTKIPLSMHVSTRQNVYTHATLIPLHQPTDCRMTCRTYKILYLTLHNMYTRYHILYRFSLWYMWRNKKENVNYWIKKCSHSSALIFHLSWISRWEGLLRPGTT